MSALPRQAVHGIIDADGRLTAAEPPLAELHARAGGTPGGPVALPPLAAIVRLVRRHGIVISRGVVVADGDRDLDLWVRATPYQGGARVAIVGWHVRPPRIEPVAERDFVRAEHDWWWQSDAALTLTALPAGAPGQDLVGAPLSHLVTLESADDGALPLIEAQAERRGFHAQHARLRRGDGGRVRLAGTPILDDAGSFSGFRGTAVRLDLGPQPTADSSAEAFGDRLGDALRRPINRIIAAADAIGAREDGPLRYDYAGYAADIASAGRHLLALVGDLVDLSAIERPDYHPAREVVDLADLARRAAGLLSLRALDGKVRVDTPQPDETLPAVGEFGRVLQILVNLIGNAIRYSPPGAAVWVRAETDGGTARIVVADQGKGIAAEDQARIFEKFERVDPGEPGGTGLGLYIARRLACAMGGALTVDSAPGQGARFTLTLPTR